MWLSNVDGRRGSCGFGWVVTYGFGIGRVWSWWCVDEGVEVIICEDVLSGLGGV